MSCRRHVLLRLAKIADVLPPRGSTFSRLIGVEDPFGYFVAKLDEQIVRRYAGYKTGEANARNPQQQKRTPNAKSHSYPANRKQLVGCYNPLNLSSGLEEAFR